MQEEPKSIYLALTFWPNTWITLIWTNCSANNQATIFVPRYSNGEYFSKAAGLTMLKNTEKY